MQLIGITGKARSGKDTVAQHLADHYRFAVTAYAKPIKDGVKAMFGLTDEHVYGSLKETILPDYGCSPRQIMQWAGTEFGRQLVHPDVWLMQVERQWQDLQATAEETFGNGLIVTDVRFENEAAQIRDLGGVVLHIERPDAQAIAAHSSEAGVRREASDHVIHNTTTLKHLYESVDTWAYMQGWCKT